MNKADIVTCLRNKRHMPQERAEKIVNLLFQSIISAIPREDVYIAGFGEWTVKQYNNLKGVSRKTKLPVTFSNTRVLFRLDKAFKKKLNTDVYFD